MGTGREGTTLSYGRFRFVRAETDELKEKIYRLRYEVYVEEFGFEKPEDHPGNLETDAYESCAIHFAALDPNDEVVGTIRLILHSEKGFPIEEAVEIRFPGEKPPPEKIAEISRLAVSHKYRRRHGDGQFGVESYLRASEGGEIPDEGRVPRKYRKRRTPEIVMGLYQIMYHESKRLGLTHWYMITEDKVYRLFKRFGFVFHPIGEPVYYHGVRRPYLGVISEMESALIRENPVLMKLVLRGLEKEYQPVFSLQDQLRMMASFPHFARKGLRFWKGRLVDARRRD
ncbi:MAG: PEP-CTERM/exosortase system-associated acyltransferase [Deltaproteobacteria bacterium]|nr:PEP-CTERM/exosortase system-associated acyltransferase [Deltaproteobacteria bacterium]